VRCLQGGPGAACQRSGQDAINAEGGTSPNSRVVRRRVLSAINADSTRSRGLTSGSARLAYVTGNEPRGRIGSPPEQGVHAQSKARTRVSTGPLLTRGFPLSRDLVAARTLLRGIWVVRTGVRCSSRRSGSTGTS
jgi:hypothetical protein